MGRQARMSCQDSRAINLFARDDDYGETAEWLTVAKRTTSDPSNDVDRLRITGNPCLIVFDHRNKTSLAQTRSNAADPRTKGREKMDQGSWLKHRGPRCNKHQRGHVTYCTLSLYHPCVMTKPSHRTLCCAHPRTGDSL
jgi:hypothetical protein